MPADQIPPVRVLWVATNQHGDGYHIVPYEQDQFVDAHLRLKALARVRDEAKLLPPTLRESVRKAGFGWRRGAPSRGTRGLDLHDLRHTGATWAAEEGASIAELMFRLATPPPAWPSTTSTPAGSEIARSAADCRTAMAFALSLVSRPLRQRLLWST